jgi:hypothetical protein
VGPTVTKTAEPLLPFSLYPAVKDARTPPTRHHCTADRLLPTAATSIAADFKVTTFSQQREEKIPEKKHRHWMRAAISL